MVFLLISARPNHGLAKHVPRSGTMCPCAKRHNQPVPVRRPGPAELNVIVRRTRATARMAFVVVVKYIRADGARVGRCTMRVITRSDRFDSVLTCARACYDENKPQRSVTYGCSRSEFMYVKQFRRDTSFVPATNYPFNLICCGRISVVGKIRHRFVPSGRVRCRRRTPSSTI